MPTWCDQFGLRSSLSLSLRVLNVVFFGLLSTNSSLTHPIYIVIIALCVLSKLLLYSYTTHLSSPLTVVLSCTRAPPHLIEALRATTVGLRSVIGLERLVPMHGLVLWPYYAIRIMQKICCARIWSWSNLIHGLLLAKISYLIYLPVDAKHPEGFEVLLKWGFSCKVL